MRKLLFIAVLFFPVALLAQKQGQALVDSLLKARQVVPNDTAKVKLLTNLSFNYSGSNPDEGIKYGLEGLALAEELQWKKGLAWTNNAIGYNYLSKSDYHTALDYFYKALKTAEELSDKKSIASFKGNIGIVYWHQDNYPKALQYHFDAYKLNTEIGDKKAIAANLGNIGIVYKSQKNYTAALEYYFKALKIKEETGDKRGIAINCGNIGEVFEYQGNRPSALAFYFRALRLAEELGNKNLVETQLCNIGESYLELARDTSGKIKKDSLIAGSKSQNLERAIEYLGQAYKICKDLGYLEGLQAAAKNLSEARALSGKYKEALDFYKESVGARDSVNSTENNIKITNLETQREKDLKDKQIVIDKLEVAKKRNERGFFIAGMVLLVAIIFIVFRSYKAQKSVNHLLNIEKKKSEDLLLNILPAEVAEELKESGEAHARQFEDVTVLFTDFVDFTKAGEKMTPKALVGELHACFKAFDDILNKYNIEKIKTVGDAYLAVSGLPNANPDHAEHVVAAAVEIRNFMQQRKEQLGDATFGIRIGIHSGSVVAGIVGVKKFAYDIWGDTVNTAARMEQNSEDGKINISETTHKLIKDRFACLYRGKVEAKNKGVIDMYFVLS